MLGAIWHPAVLQKDSTVTKMLSQLTLGIIAHLQDSRHSAVATGVSAVISFFESRYNLARHART